LVVTSIDHLWVADITYIRLQLEFVYLAVLLLFAFHGTPFGFPLESLLTFTGIPR
jgi:hypothetical protein